MQATCAIFAAYVALYKPCTELPILMILTDSAFPMPGGCVCSRPTCTWMSWLTTEIGVPILLRTGPHARDFNVDDVSAKPSISISAFWSLV